MVAPVRAWAVRLSVSPDDTEGTLFLADDELLFDLAHAEGALHIALADIRKVKRLRGSPVLIVEADERDRRARFAFYFVKPPPLKPVGRETKRRVKRQAITYLQTQNADQVERLKEWGVALRDAVERARGSGS